MDIKEKIKNLPSTPGVYLMKDSLDSIIYVGKSKNLKSRVGSYFVNSKAHSPKVEKLVKNLKDFDYILTDTEFEAFMLECNLIKKIKPIYNKLMKSPKSYSYIKITLKDKYPQLQRSNECVKDDGNMYFGPYTNKNTVERALEGIKECCKILCKNSGGKASSCLYYSLGTCIGMCMDPTPSKEYLDIFDKILRLLKGTDRTIIEEMERNMMDASEKFDFEAAAKYRDYLNAVSSLIDKLKVVEYTEENKNIAFIEPLSDDSFKFFLIKGNKVLFSEKYSPIDLDTLKLVLKNNILHYFNNKTLENSIEIGREEIDEAQIIYSYLKNKANNCSHIIISEKWLEGSSHSTLDTAINELIKPENL